MLFCFRLLLFSALLLVLYAPASTLPVHAQPWKFAVISDTHDTDKAGTLIGVTPYLKSIIDYIIAEKPDFVLETGDLITGVLTKKTSPVYQKFDVQYSYYQQTVAPLAAVGIPLRVIRGNHDYGVSDVDTAATAEYQQRFPAAMPQNGPDGAKGLTYSFVHKNVKFILIDQYVNATNAQVTLPLGWLKKELAQREMATHLFVLGHSPAYAPNDKDNGDADGHFNLSDQPALRDSFWQLLIDYQATAYICGHKHLYCRGIASGVPQLITGTLGSASGYDPQKVDRHLSDLFPNQPVSKKNDRPGYLIVTIDDESNRVTAREYWLDEQRQAYLYDTVSLTH